MIFCLIIRLKNNKSQKSFGEMNIAVINKIRTPAVKTDETLLSKSNNLYVYNYKHRKGYSIYFDHFRLLIWLIINRNKYDLIYSRFIDKHSFICVFLSKVLNKKTIVIPAGEDIANLPKINFGVLRKKVNRIIARFVYNNASLVIPVSEFAKTALINNIPVRSTPKIHVVSNGIDTNFYKPIEEKRKEQFITVGGCETFDRIKLKGINTYIEVARYFTNYDFYVIGIHPTLQKEITDLTGNVFLIPWLQPVQLRKYLSESKFICQLSVYETFGIAFAQGMACGCIPITYADIGTKELIQNSGIVIPSRDMDTTIKYFENALKIDEKYGLSARKNIKDHYSLELRFKKLNSLITQLKKTKP